MAAPYERKALQEPIVDFTAPASPPSVAKRNYSAIVVGSFAIVWLAARAVMQSVTIDEADSYLSFAAQDWPSHWYPSSGNHVLNSIGVRLMTWLFGLSELTLRAPALIGAAIYIFASYKLCKMVARGSRLFPPLFACFVLNPFVMDYLVAARGYSLALGFLALGFSMLPFGLEKIFKHRS